MTEVQNRIFDASGDGIEGVAVAASLASPGYLDDGTIVSAVSTTSDENGLWSLDLPPNTDINPEGTHYRVKEAGRVSAIVVPDSAGTHEMTDLLVAAPEDPDSVTVGVTSVDGRDGIVILSDLYAALEHASRHESGGADELNDVIHTNADTDFENFDDFIAVIDQADDSATEPDTTLWPNRLELRYRGQLVQWWNETNEWRGVPSQPGNDGSGVGTVGWRMFAALNDTAYNARDASTPVWEIRNYRSGAGSGARLLSLNHLGELTTETLPEWADLSLQNGVTTWNETPATRLEPLYRVVRMKGQALNDTGVQVDSGEVIAIVDSEHRPPNDLEFRLTRAAGTDDLRMFQINSATGEITSSSGLADGEAAVFDNVSWPMNL